MDSGNNKNYNSNLIKHIKSIEKYIKQDKQIKKSTEKILLDTWCGKNNITYVKDYRNKITKKCKNIKSKKEWEKELKNRNLKLYNKKIIGITPLNYNNKFINNNINNNIIDGDVGSIVDTTQTFENILISQIELDNYNKNKKYLINLSSINEIDYDEIKNSCEEGCSNYFLRASNKNFDDLQLENNQISFQYLIIESPGIIINSLKRNNLTKLKNNSSNLRTWDSYCSYHGVRPYRWIWKTRITYKHERVLKRRGFRFYYSSKKVPVKSKYKVRELIKGKNKCTCNKG